jgi:hypothetical protein
LISPQDAAFCEHSPRAYAVAKVSQSLNGTPHRQERSEMCDTREHQTKAMEKMEQFVIGQKIAFAEQQAPATSHAIQ